MRPPLSVPHARLFHKFFIFIFCGLLLSSLANAQIHLEFDDAGRKVKSRTVPEYPELARKLKITGTVRVEFTITPEGAVKEVHELGGNPVLLDAVVRAVKQWKYEPGAKDTAVEVKANFSTQ